MTVALLIVPSWPLVGALAIVGALSALDFLAYRATLLDTATRNELQKAARVATDMAERVDRCETQVRFLTAQRGGIR